MCAPCRYPSQQAALGAEALSLAIKNSLLEMVAPLCPALGSRGGGKTIK